MIEVVHFQRRPGPRAFSIERLFDDLRAALPPDVRVRKHVVSHASEGLWRRLAAVLDAGRHRGPVNHITGDVHFLTFGLPGHNTILTIHDCGILHRSRGLKHWLFKQFWFTLPMSRSRVVTAISEATRRELIGLQAVPVGKIRVIYDCVSPLFIPAPAAFNGVRPTILLLGTAPNKNLERIAIALEGIPCVVELIGQPTSQQRQLFIQRGLQLIELGDVQNAEIIQAYRRCDLVLFASTHEGFGLPILEAQATGRPVVTGNCSSMPEVAGDAACLVDPFDPVAIRSGIERVIRDEIYRGQLLLRGFENVRRFSTTQIAAEYAKLYREVALAHRE